MVDYVYNTTVGLSSLQTVGSWFPTLGLVLVATIAIGFLLIAFSTAWFKRFFKIFGIIGRSIFYFIKGALTVAAGYLIYYLGDLLGQTASQIPIEWIFYAIGFYIGCSLLGWFVTKIYGKIKTNYKEAR